ncbi:MAG: AMP-binding protein, partial [bacterium]|nr:AMP-binding protein [bacterium]
MMTEKQSNNKSITAHLYIKEETYWLEKLSDNPGKSRIPYDQKEDRQTGRETVIFTITGDTAQRLAALSRGSETNLHMILTANLYILLNKYTGSCDLLIGTPIYKQEDEGEGDYVNTMLPLRNTIDSDKTFKALLLQVRQTIKEACQHQNYPMEMLTYRLGMEYSTEDFPLFEVVIKLESIHDNAYIHPLNPAVILTFTGEGETFSGKLDYKARLYEKETIETLAGHYQNILQTVLEEINVKTSEIDLLTEEERQRLLVEFNETEQETPAQMTIIRKFQQQALETPGNIAVVFEQEKYTYRRLNREAAQLARHLREKGAKKNTIVGVMADYSKTMILAVLGILKAGAAYLPIDPEAPTVRIEYMLKDSNTRLVLTGAENTAHDQPGEEPAFEGEIIK